MYVSMKMNELDIEFEFKVELQGYCECLFDH